MALRNNGSEAPHSRCGATMRGLATHCGSGTSSEGLPQRNPCADNLRLDQKSYPHCLSAGQLLAGTHCRHRRRAFNKFGRVLSGASIASRHQPVPNAGVRVEGKPGRRKNQAAESAGAPRAL